MVTLVILSKMRCHLIRPYLAMLLKFVLDLYTMVSYLIYKDSFSQYNFHTTNYTVVPS